MRPVFLLEVGDQLVGDGVAVGAEVLRVHRVRVVVVRVGVLDLDEEVARIVGRGPVLVELIRQLLLGAVVALPVKPLGVLGRQIRIRRLLAPSADRVRKVPVVDDEGITGVRVRVVALGQQDVRAEVHRTAPELREPLGEQLLVLDVLRGRGLRDRRDDLVEDDRDRPGLRGIDRDLFRRRVEVAGSLVPLLAFAAIHRQLDDVAVGAPERLVAMQERLDAVRAGGEIREAARGETRARRPRRRRARRPSSPRRRRRRPAGSAARCP